MSDSLRNALIRIALIAILACYYVGGLVADNPRAIPPSQFAPLADLAADLDRRVAALESAVALPAAHRKPAATLQEQALVDDQALVIAIVAQQMATHDHGSAEGTDPLPAREGQSLGTLVRQIPICYEQLRRDIYSSRFTENHAALAGSAATLAALANYCTEAGDCRPSDFPRGDWERICFALRDSARDVNLACHARNQTAAMAALRRTEICCQSWLEAAQQR